MLKAAPYQLVTPADAAKRPRATVVIEPFEIDAAQADAFMSFIERVAIEELRIERDAAEQEGATACPTP